jgi:hypothetical protein
MFVKRDKYNTNVFILKAGFIKLVEELNEIGFKDVEVKIPLNEISSERAGKEPIPVKTFLQQDRNYKGLILLGRRNKDEIRILFKNEGQGSFLDDIFPSVGSNTLYNFYVSTSNPVETQGLSLYIKDFFDDYKVSSFFSGSTPIYIFYFFLILSISANIFFKLSGFNMYFLWFVGAGFVIYSAFVSPQKGLYFHSPDDAKKIPKYIEKVKEQWLLILVTAICAFLFGLLGDFVRKTLGLSN